MSSKRTAQMKSCLKKAAATSSSEKPGATPPKKKNVQFSTTSWLYTIPQEGLGWRLTKYHPRLLPPIEWPADEAAQVQLARERTRSAWATKKLYSQWMKTQGWISIAYGASKKQLTREWRQYAEYHGLQREIPRTPAATSTVKYTEDLSLAKGMEKMRLDNDDQGSVHDPLCFSPEGTKAVQASSMDKAGHKGSTAKSQHGQNEKVLTMKSHSDIQQHPHDESKVKFQDEKQKSNVSDIDSIMDGLILSLKDIERVGDDVILSLKQLLAILLVFLVVSLGMLLIIWDGRRRGLA